MTGLDSASNDVIRFAEKMAELESKIKKQKLKFWKGKKIISEKEC